MSIPTVKHTLSNGWTLLVAGPDSKGEIWVQMSAPAPSGAYSAHWIPAHTARGKVLQDFIAAGGGDPLPEPAPEPNKSGLEPQLPLPLPEPVISSASITSQIMASWDANGTPVDNGGVPS